MAYLDCAATTPLRPEAREAMLPFLSERFGNPSGVHGAARDAKTALEESREVVAFALGARPDEIVFTGGGTEADNLAVKGAARAARDAGSGRGVVISVIEHPAVLRSCQSLESEGFRLTTTPVDRTGVLNLDAFADALDPQTVVVSVMAVNNEVGTVQPLAEVVEVVRRLAPRAVLHSDAVQAPQWVDLAAATAGFDLVAVSAHKFGGPKGVGALVVRRGVQVAPLLHGGGQERGLRSGTHDVAGAVGMATALATTVSQRAAELRRLGGLRDRLADGLASAIPGLVVNADPAYRVAGSLHLTIPGIEIESLLLLLDREGVAAAAGSACHSGSLEPSPVLLAMGMSRALALSSLRLSLGWCSRSSEIDTALAVIPAAVERLRLLPAGRR